MISVSYAPGDWTAVTGAGIWMLIHAAPGSASVTGIWQRVQRDPELNELITELLTAGFGRLPDFALLAASSDGMHLICRGLGAAAMISAAGAQRVDGRGTVTWTEQVVTADVTRVVLGSLPADDDMTLPGPAGVFLARGVVIDLAATSDFQPGQVGLGGAAASSHSADSAHFDDSAADLPSAAKEDGFSRRELAEDSEYDDALVGSTRARSIEGAAIRPADEADLRPALLSPAPHVPGFDDRRADPDPEPAALPLAMPSGMIMSVPWDLGNADATTDDDEGLTVRRGAHPEAAAMPVLADHIGPVVLAVLCPRQHLNPPKAEACRICDEPVPEQDPVSVSRPVLGVLRLSTGDVISLDRGVIMGRKPPQAEFDGEERLHSVKLPGHDDGISRVHLKVTLDGWRVMITDLQSRNGTLITLPGRDPEPARATCPMQIQPGTVVTLADGIHFRFEVTG